MTVQPAPVPGRALERLFTPGIRLGWTYRDRRMLAAPYPEPQPYPELVHEQIAKRSALTHSRYARARRELEAWQQRAAAHQEAELDRIGDVPEWSATSPPALRTDIFDSSLADLARYAGDAQPTRRPAPAYYTCLALESAARSARAEMLTALAVLEAERRHVPLTVLYRSQRTATLGGSQTLTQPAGTRLASLARSALAALQLPLRKAR